MLKHLYFSRKITQSELNTLIKKMKNQKTSLGVSHLLKNEGSTPLQKLVYGLEEADKHERNLE